MGSLVLSARIRRKRKYSSYQEELVRKQIILFNANLKQPPMESATQMWQSLPFRQAVKSSIYHQF